MRILLLFSLCFLFSCSSSIDIENRARTTLSNYGFKEIIVRDGYIDWTAQCSKYDLENVSFTATLHGKMTQGVVCSNGYGSSVRIKNVRR
jgi:hypothetical protein